MPIRIAIDARESNNSSGTGNYINALVRHIVPLASDVEFTLLLQPRAATPLAEELPVKVLRLPGDTKSLHTIGLALRRSIHRFDLFHSPVDMVPPGLRCPFVVTVHDLMWIEAPHLASAFLPSRWFHRHWYRANFGYAIRRAQSVIAISQTTAGAIRRVFHTDGGKVKVIYHGIDAKGFLPDDTGGRRKLDPWVPRGTRYALVVGQGSPYKNHANIVRAFLRAMRERTDYKLVLVRRFVRIDNEMRILLADPLVRSKVVSLPCIPADVLLNLYRHASMFLFASHYEGFGMPILEAMACGIPVLSSRAPALVEVAGDAALYADAGSVEDMAEKIGRLATDTALRSRLIAAGKERVRHFSWRKCAVQTLAVYRQTLADSHRSR